MMKTKIGVISDLHLLNKTVNIENALSKENDVYILLIIDDIGDVKLKWNYLQVICI